MSTPLAISQLSNGLSFRSTRFRLANSAPKPPKLRPAELRNSCSTDAILNVSKEPNNSSNIYHSLIEDLTPSSLRSIFTNKTSSQSLSKPTTIHDIPTEVLEHILSFLGQADLLRVMTVSKLLTTLAVRHLYAAPEFMSTYRFAQFVSTVAHNPSLASLVKNIDLSNIPNHPHMAGWIEWKLRRDPVYSLTASRSHPIAPLRIQDTGGFGTKPSNRRRASASEVTVPKHRRAFRLLRFSRKKVKQDFQTSSTTVSPRNTRGLFSIITNKGNHPTKSILLKQYSDGKDIPIGYILHLLKCCKNMRSIVLNGIKLATDYKVVSNHKSTSTSGAIFVSEVGRLHQWSLDEIKSVSAEDIMLEMQNLQDLNDVQMCNVTWLSKAVVEKLLDSDKTFEHLDLRDSGVRGSGWAMEGSSEQIQRALKL